MTSAQVIRRMKARERAVKEEFSATMRGVRTAAEKFCKETMLAEIYAIPEDTNVAGEKKWTRTRNLLNNEKGELTQPYEVQMRNVMPYAVRRERASAAAGRGPKGRGDVHYINPLRESHWRQKMVDVFEPLFPDLLHETLLAILKRTAP